MSVHVVTAALVICTTENIEIYTFTTILKIHYTIFNSSQPYLVYMCVYMCIFILIFPCLFYLLFQLLVNDDLTITIFLKTLMNYLHFSVI